jgi:hypothetical protein
MAGQLERAVTEKKPVPMIDFTLHTMEDGTQVSTQERVCKGIIYIAVPSRRLCSRQRRIKLGD